MRQRVALGIMILCVMLAACGGGSTSLTGVTWTVTAMPGVGVDPTVPITAVFGTDGKITGSGGCNSYSAGYTTSGSNLSIDSPMSSMMSCNETVDQQESQYFYLLEGDGTYQISGNKLTLKNSSGQTTIEYTSGN